MANIVIQGKVKITIVAPHGTLRHYAHDNGETNRQRMRNWAQAVGGCAFEDGSGKFVHDVSVGFADRQNGNARITILVTGDRSDAKIIADANALADRIYGACGTSLAEQLALDEQSAKEGVRMWPRVEVEWTQKLIELVGARSLGTLAESVAAA